MYPFELYTIYTLAMPVGSISDSGRTLIAAYIRAQRLREGAWAEKNPENTSYGLKVLPDDWDWRWVVTGKGDYVGTFPKRLGKFYYKEQLLNCPAEFLSAIGNLAREHTADNLSYRFEFVNQIDWEDGDYGDSGSCWWGQYANARDTLIANGGLAIRFYNALDEGIGRAWIVPENGLFYLFNGYGFTGNSTLIIAHVMATHLGLSYKKVYLSNNGEHYNTLYINNGSGFAIGTPEAIESITSHDFEFKIEGERCENCGTDIDGDEYTAPDGTQYCSSCFYDRCNSCERCGETYWNDDLTYVEDCGDYCEHCLNLRFILCSECDEYHPRADNTVIDDNDYCLSCRDENFTLCSECETWKDNESIVHTDDDKYLCSECHKPE